MKRVLIMAMTAILLLIMSVGSVSAASAAKQIHVDLNGKEVVFPAPPVVLSGKTFVEFRTLFTALGYKIDYVAATKKIKATSSERTIEMGTTGSTALVNGSPVPVNGEMIIINGRTLVGVRFIATLSDKNVEWNAAKQTVFITDKRPTKAQTAAIFDVLDKLAAAEAANDAAGYASLFYSQYHDRDEIKANMEAQFAISQIKTTYIDKTIDTYSNSEAVVVTTEQIKKISGSGFYPNNESEYVYTLRKEKTGEWRILSIDQQSFTVTDVDSLWKQEVQAPDADKTAINALLNDQIKAINSSNIDAYRATLNPSADGLEDDIVDMKSAFDAITLTMTLEKSAIVELNDNSAVLLTQMTINQKDDQDSFTYRTITEMYLTKKDGKWVFELSPTDLYAEDL
ncbi:hypothetical protein Back11_58540 [Paenibacillus baekrokdamisoli]|uniref:Copper amine oxidase-like N-terminal domain-containing protein n=1 Tax=Paenibacillus baekrokdamisoli TaxID=1712516 RepID=A0A3G9JN91_9BACL|nr:copper amine oxidase N-terminal domain-containing protein [Paenibacillus baekrokdamisoli]MBB3071460.1 ketosteroid isomerase-like protein [Paenibacillus baekrokdamisoli]BBH24509.1 hypothetical protein Back11_58540 [Paenibacillus baekrokdamisoli]